MKKLILMLLALFVASVNVNATPKRLFVKVEKSDWANNATGLNIYIWNTSNSTDITSQWPGAALTRIGNSLWFYADIDSDVTTAKCKINTNDATRWQTNESSEFDLSKNTVIYLNTNDTPNLYPNNFDGFVLSKGYTAATDKLIDLDQDGLLLTGTLDLTAADWDVTFQAFPSILSESKYYVGELGISPNTDSGNFMLSSFIQYNDAVKYGYTTDKWEDKLRVKYDVTINLATNQFTLSPSFTRTIGTDGYSTFSYDYDVAIPAGVKAYYATTAGGGKVNMTSFGDAGTGINSADGAFLQAEPGPYTFTPATDNPEAKSGNLLKKTTGSDIYDTSGGKVQYVFAKQGEPSELGFYKLAKSLSPAKGKAYLETVGSAAGARLTISFDDEDDVTGIANVREAANNKQFFNLNGQRVAQPQKGLYIVNGKKMLMK